MRVGRDGWLGWVEGGCGSAGLGLDEVVGGSELAVSVWALVSAVALVALELVLALVSSGGSVCGLCETGRTSPSAEILSSQTFGHCVSS